MQAKFVAPWHVAGRFGYLTQLSYVQISLISTIMSKNHQTYPLSTFILGIVGFMMFSAYTSSLAIMYPDHPEGFNRMFKGLLIGALVVGALRPLKSLRSRLATFGFITLLLLSVVTLMVGLVFAYDTKTDEFLIYFLLTALITLVMAAVSAAVVRLIIFGANLGGKEIILVVGSGLAGVLIGYFLHLVFNSAEAIYFWFLIACLLIVLQFISRSKISPGYTFG